MDMNKNYIPDGTKDVLFKECSAKKDIVEKIRRVYLERNYKEVMTPTLEYYDVFHFDNQPIKQEEMYKFFDKKGRILVLRPDMTMPIARICNSKINRFPIKLSYSENVFRINESLNGKLNEITQSGVEIIGASDVKADAEIIITAIQALLNVGINNFKIEIGQINFYKSIIEDLGMDEEETEKLRLLVENKNFASVRNFVNERKNNINKNTTEVLKKLPELFGNIDVVNEVYNITDNKNALEALDNIKAVYNIIDSMGYGDYITVDLGMVHHINYYTGIIFRGYVNGVGEEILSGGRYDNLLKEFGENNYATGFAINIDNVLKSLELDGKIEDIKRDYLIYYKNNCINRAYDIYENIKNKYNIEISLNSTEEEAKKYCIDNNIEKLIVIKEEYEVIYDIINNTKKEYTEGEIDE